MKKKISLIFLLLFSVLSIIFSVLLAAVDVRSSYNNTSLGLATMNEKIFNAIGESKLWYVITQILGYVAIIVVITYAIIGIIQLVKRKSIKEVDKEIIGLGIVYILIGIIYVLFEKVVIVNYRPVLEDGALASSFPSSHTLLACVVFSTALLAFKKLVKNNFLRNNLIYLVEFLVILMIGGRLLSGVHWASDIIASVLYSGIIVSGYYYLMYLLEEKNR